MREKNPLQPHWQKVGLAFNSLAVVKSCASLACQMWCWKFPERGWSSSSMGPGHLAGTGMGWRWSQHTSSWSCKEVVLVRFSQGVRCCCQSDQATGARCAPGALDNSCQQKETESPKWWNEDNSKLRLQFHMLFVTFPLSLELWHLKGQI